jgi:hypothetical protein
MPISNDYGKLAEECYRLANEAKTETDRQACIDLMQSWLDTASRQENKAAEQLAAAQRAPEIKHLQRPVRLTSWRQRLLSLIR